MKKWRQMQKWVGAGTIVFVIIYLGAIVITIKSRTDEKIRTETIESARYLKEESHLILPELLLPMGILFCLSASYLIIRRRNEKKYDQLDDDIEDLFEE